MSEECEHPKTHWKIEKTWIRLAGLLIFVALLAFFDQRGTGKEKTQLYSFCYLVSYSVSSKPTKQSISKTAFDSTELAHFISSRLR